MATYAVKVRRGSRITTHRIAAASRAAASREGRQFGSVMSVRRDLLNEFRPKLNQQQRDALLSRIATMNDAGVGPSKTLEMIEESGAGNVSRVAGEMRDKLNANKGLIGALEAHPQDFPTDLVALIRAGMEAGNTSQAIRDALDYQENIRQAREGSLGGLVSAIGTVFLAGASVIAVQEFLVPRIQSNPMLQNANVSTAWIDPYATALVFISTFMILSIILFATLGTVIRSAMPGLVDKIILIFPVYRDIVLAIRQYITFYRLSMLIASGISYERCLRLTAHNAPAGVLRNDLLRGVQAVKVGRSWQDEMTSITEIDRFALKFGSDRQQIAQKLLAIGNSYRELYKRRLKSIVPTLKFVGVILISAAILIIFGKAILPMLKFSATGF